MSATPAPSPREGASDHATEPAMSAPAPAPPGAGDLALDADVACDLFSEHGGEIVITDDGRIVFMNASAHLVELAAALDPDNADVKARLAHVEAARARASAATPASGMVGGPAATGASDGASGGAAAEDAATGR